MTSMFTRFTEKTLKLKAGVSRHDFAVAEVVA
jgi:hypothetical protein